MLRTKRFLILKRIKIKENFVGIAKTMLQKHHKIERKMTAQFLAQLLQRLQNTDVGLHSTAQSFASRTDRSLETRLSSHSTRAVEVQTFEEQPLSLLTDI